MTDREVMKMALDALKNTATRSAAEQYAVEQNAIAALEAALAQPDETETLKRCLFQMQEVAKALAQTEQEEPLPLVDIGVDVTPEGTHVVACYNRHDAVQEMFYSQFHPLARPESHIVKWSIPVDPNNFGEPLAQPEQVSIEPPDYVEPITFDYHEGWEEGFEAAKNLFKKESAPQNADPRLLLGRKDNCTALAQPEQEPVAKHVCNLWINPETSFYEVDRCTHPINEVFPVYTAPPKREWVGLTDDEIDQIAAEVCFGYIDVARAIEAKLKEKNT